MKKIALIGGASVALVVVGAVIYSSMKKSSDPAPVEETKPEPQEQKEEEIIQPDADGDLPFVPRRVMSAAKRR